jgi:hypothetical protein
VFFEHPITRAITLIGIRSERCNRLISAQFSTDCTSLPPWLDWSQGLGRGSVFGCRQGVSFHVPPTNAPRRMVGALTSADASTFWSAYWEITVARAFQNMEFVVDLAPRVGGRTPDMVVTRPDLRSIVEVFAVTSRQGRSRGDGETHPSSG